MMNIEYHKWWSNNLNRDMEMKVYGHGGRSILVFPAQGGRFFEFEDFKMVDTVSELIEKGVIRLFTVDSVDNLSWANFDVHPSQRGPVHENYDRYIINDVVPFIHNKQGNQNGIITTGVSMGGYQSGNFFFRHPDIFSGVISLSGLFSLKIFVGDFVDDYVYFNSPLLYLPNLNDENILNKIRSGNIIVCCGTGAWEDEMISDISKLKGVLEQKNIPAWIDFWGKDVNHDWPWWLKQFPYFVYNLYHQGKL